MKYTYSFCVWPDETWQWDKHIFPLFRMIQTRIEMLFTPEEFEQFRFGVSHHGLTIREIERWVHTEVESVL